MVYFVPNGYMVHGKFITCPVCNNRFKEEVSPKPDPWTCPRCSTVQRKASYIFQGALTTYKKNKITISLPKERETLQFNMDKGRIIFASDKLSHPLDVTEHKELLSEKMLIVLRAAKTRELLLDAFQNAWGPKRVPFLLHELSVETLFLITRFVGYPKTFYSHLPLILGTLKLPKEFRKTAKRIHYAENIIKLTSMLNWGQSEEIRFLIFKNPALLIYQKSLSMIYACLGKDSVAFYDLLSIEPQSLFENLAFLTDCPTCEVFLQDYIYEAGKENYLKLVQYPDLFNECARSYACLTPQKRTQVKQTFKTGLDPLAFSVKHSLPTRLPSVEDTTINVEDGATFDFIVVKNTTEMRRLGEKLENPVLKNLAPPLRFIDGASAIIGVWKGFKPVASIEIMDNCIFEILGVHDSPFDTLDDSLKKAISIWKERHRLEEAEGNSYFTSHEDDNYFCF